MKQVKNKASKSAMLLRDTYDLYAKMLAVENIRCVFDEAIDAPAQFDILNRILYISPVHTAQAHLIPGLVIHEVGHALFSTLTDKEAKKLKRITKLLNIIDDGYQERKMCQKYAGAKKHLYTIFDEFFIKTGDDAYNTPNDLINIVNVLNYNCKGFKHGKHKQYPPIVQPDDLLLLREAEMINLPTLIERDDFAKVLAKALKKYGEMPDEGKDLNKKGAGEKGDGEKGDQPLMDDEDAETEEGEGPGESGDEDADEGGEDDSKGDGNESAEDQIEKQLSKNESKLNDHHKKIKQTMGKTGSFELPTGFDLLQVADITDVYTKGGVVDEALSDTKNLTLTEKWGRIRKEAKAIAGRIYTKFNMRVQASNYANTQYKKSGTLDPERVALYQVFDDVFQKTAIDQNQSNHAYSIMLDWSGSMDSSIGALTLRIMELVYFANMADIEVEVWLYTTGHTAVKKSDHKNFVMMGSHFIKVINTKKCNPIELEQRLKHFWLLGHETGYSHSPKLAGDKAQAARNELTKMCTGGTNILEGLILGHHVLSKMVADVKTCFLLSDGSDSGGFDTAVKKGSKASVGQPKVYLNGFNVDFLYNHGNTRLNATCAIADLYEGAGQRTTGIAWNCSGAQMEHYTKNIIKAKGVAVKGDYLHADNLFIDEIVKNLL